MHIRSAFKTNLQQHSQNCFLLNHAKKRDCTHERKAYKVCTMQVFGIAFSGDCLDFLEDLLLVGFYFAPLCSLLHGSPFVLFDGHLLASDSVALRVLSYQSASSFGDNLGCPFEVSFVALGLFTSWGLSGISCFFSLLGAQTDVFCRLHSLRPSCWIFWTLDR